MRALSIISISWILLTLLVSGCSQRYVLEQYQTNDGKYNDYRIPFAWSTRAYFQFHYHPQVLPSYKGNINFNSNSGLVTTDSYSVKVNPLDKKYYSLFLTGKLYPKIFFGSATDSFYQSAQDKLFYVGGFTPYKNVGANKHQMRLKVYADYENKFIGAQIFFYLELTNSKYCNTDIHFLDDAIVTFLSNGGIEI